MRSAALVARHDISRTCPDNVRNLREKTSSSSTSAEGGGNGGKTTVTTELAAAVDNLDTEDRTVLNAAKSAVVVVNVVK